MLTLFNFWDLFVQVWECASAIVIIALVHVIASASLAQLVARRSHNPKVVSSILTGGNRVSYGLAKLMASLWRGGMW